MLPEAVPPYSEYAVAELVALPHFRVECGGTDRGGGTRVEQPAKHAAVTSDDDRRVLQVQLR
jgi:hypothetical protein